MIYKASLDLSSKIMTALAFVFFGFVIFKLSGDLQQNISDPDQVFILSAAMGTLVLTLLFCFLFMTRGYKIENGELIIIRVLKNVKLSLSEIELTEKLDKTKLKGTIRTFGVGGFFGYFGKFYNSKIGKMTYYATKREGGLLIKTNDGKLIRITPDEEDEFLKELELAKKFS